MLSQFVFIPLGGIIVALFCFAILVQFDGRR